MVAAFHGLAEALGDVKMSQFHMAGTKDRRAVTSQFVTVRGVTADRWVGGA